MAVGGNQVPPPPWGLVSKPTRALHCGPIPSGGSTLETYVRDRAPASDSRAFWLALGLLAAAAWLLRAFVAAPGPFHENFHGYAGLGLDPFSVPGRPSVTSSYLALMRALGLHGDRLIAANQVVSALVVVPASLVARDLLRGSLPGLLAGALVAVHPLLARLGASEDPFAFYTLLLLLSIAGGRLALRHGSLAGFAGAALLASLAAFVRDSTVVAGPVFVLLTLDRLPTRRRAVVLGLCLVPFASGVLRALTFDALPTGEGVVPSSSLAERWLPVARLATIGGLEVLRTPAAFPWLALGGLAALAVRLPASALRLVLALGLLQGPFAVILGSVTSPYSPARHLSPAVVLWAMPAAFALAAVTKLVRWRSATWTSAARAALGGALLLAAMLDAWPLLKRTTLLETEYAVMKQCLRQLPAEARVHQITEPRASHVAAEWAWFQAERPLWMPSSEGVLFDDRWRNRQVPGVLLIDHGCSGNVTMAATPDFSAAGDETPWAPMVPACAEAFRAREWQTVVRVDLPLDDTDEGLRTTFPVGCLIDASFPLTAPPAAP